VTPAAIDESETMLNAPPKPAPAAPSTAGMTTKVVKGSLWTLAGQIAPLAVSMVATPFTIRLLGTEGYGVLVLIAVIPNYFLFADFGMGMASTKFGSEAYAEGDPEKEARIVRTAALIATLSSLPVATLLFIFSAWIVSVFNVPERLHGEATLALKFAAVTFFVNFLNGIFNTPQLARLRMDLNTLVTSGFRILGIIATPIVIYLGFGIAGACAVLLAASLLTLSGHVYMSGRLLPSLLGLTVDRNAMRPLVKFGGALITGVVAALLLANLDKGILPRMVSVQALAYYSVAFSLAWMMAMFSNAMIQSLIPAFSLLQQEESREQLQSLYTRGLRLTLIWLTPCLVLLAISAKPFFRLWAGEDFGRESVPIFYVMLAGISFNILAFLPYAAIMASGRTDVYAKLYFAELVPYVLLLIALTYSFGAIGAATAWCMRIIADTLMLFFLSRRVAHVSFRNVNLTSFALAALYMAVPFAANLYYGELNLTVVVLFILSSIGYLLALWKIVLSVDETVWIRNRLSARFMRFGN
jgi:O-antigen/teichoic acid export membrane protein